MADDVVVAGECEGECGMAPETEAPVALESPDVAEPVAAVPTGDAVPDAVLPQESDVAPVLNDEAAALKAADLERQRQAAEQALREAEERAARKAAAAEQAEERAREAVEAIGASAGFMTRYGAYFDIKEAKNANESAQLAAAQAAALAGVPNEDDEADEEAPAAPAASEDTYVDDEAFRRQVARLTGAVARQPLHRELYYKTLVFCQESHPLREIEEYIASLAGFKGAASNPYHFIEVLEQFEGLERFDLDEEGEVVTAEQKEGLTEDEIDDLVWDYAFMTTPAGLAVVEQHTPQARIIELLGLVPERKDAYIELLEFCSEEPRTYNEIRQLFVGRDVLMRMVNGEPQTMQPSVFVDKLEAAGGMEWRDGWVLTDEGRSFLAELAEEAAQQG